jgi:RNA polymerase sigma-70 factor (ECF subfamily)
MQVDGEGAPDDGTLVARVASGDQEALGSLYDRYRPRLRRYVWRLLGGDGAAVEDCLQETFITVWRAAATFRGEGRVAAWLFRIADRAAGHARRAAASRPTHPLPLADDPSTPPDGTDEAVVLDRLSLHTAMQQLSPKHRVALELVFVFGFSIPETAQIVGVPEGTVKSRLSYARKALARALARETTTEEATS